MVQQETRLIQVKPYTNSDGFSAQYEYLRSTDYIYAYVGGRGSGKTWIGAMQLIGQILSNPGANFLVCANSYKQLMDATLSRLFKILQDLGIPYSFHTTSHILTIKDPRFTGEIRCRSLENYDSVRGAEYYMAWLDEAAYTCREAFDTLHPCVRQVIKPDGYPVSTLEEFDPELGKPNMIRITTTPNKLAARWLYDLLHDEERQREFQQKGFKVGSVHAKTKDNIHLKEETKAGFYLTTNPYMIKQELEGVWEDLPLGKPVYGEAFNMDTHTDYLVYDPYSEILMGVDFGYHHSACLIAQQDKDKRLNILSEVIVTDSETTQFIAAIKEHIAHYYPQHIKETPSGLTTIKVRTHCDIAGAQKTSEARQTAIDKFNAAGLPCIAKKVNILDGVELVHQLLNTTVKGYPSLRVAPNCQTLITGFKGGYHYPEKIDSTKADKMLPEKDGTYDHVMDALRYLVAGKYNHLRLTKPEDAAPVEVTHYDRYGL